MHSVGVIGDIGSGKSTVCAYLMSRGARVLSADQISSEVRERPEIIEKLVQVFGTDILDDRGRIDRRRLAARAFDCPSHTDELDHIVRRSIQEELICKIQEYHADEGLLVIEIPLVAGADELEPFFDGIIRVVAPDEVRLSRLISRGMDSEDAQQRMSRQRDKNVYKSREHELVLYNVGTVDELEEHIRLWLSDQGLMR